MSGYIVNIVLLIAMMFTAVRLQGNPYVMNEGSDSFDYDWSVNKCIPGMTAWHICGTYCEETCNDDDTRNCSQRDCIDNPDIQPGCRCVYQQVRETEFPYLCKLSSQCP